VDDGLLISLAVTCDQQPSTCNTLFCGRLMDRRIKRCPACPSVRPSCTTTRDPIGLGLLYSFSLSVRYTVIADGHRSYRSSTPQIF